MTVLVEDEAAEILVAAWRQGHQLADLPERVRPRTMEQAYTIQDITVRMRGATGGWKVAPPKDNGSPRCSPILMSRIFDSPAVLRLADLPAPEVEVEIAAHFARDLPKRNEPYTMAEVMAAIDFARPAIEVLSPRFRNRKAVSPLSAVADCQSNGAMVVGSGCIDWRSVDLATVGMTLSIDGQSVAKTAGGAPTAAVAAALTWLANHTVDRNGGLKADQIVITGSRLGPIPLKPGCRAEADIQGLGRVSLTIE